MKAMILAAGFGKRLGSLTHEIPKPMLTVRSKPILEHIILNLKKHGFDDLVINLHFCPEEIRDYFLNGKKWGVKITYSQETQLLGTAGGLKNCRNFFEADQTALVHYGDILTDQDFTAMLEFHRSKKALATLLLHRRENSNSQIWKDSEGRITRFSERPAKLQNSSDTWVNSGVALFEPEFLAHIPDATPCDLARDVYQNLAASGRLFGFELSGQRLAIDSPERLREAEEKMKN